MTDNEYLEAFKLTFKWHIKSLPSIVTCAGSAAWGVIILMAEIESPYPTIAVRLIGVILIVMAFVAFHQGVKDD